MKTEVIAVDEIRKQAGQHPKIVKIYFAPPGGSEVDNWIRLAPTDQSLEP